MATNRRTAYSPAWAHPHNDGRALGGKFVCECCSGYVGPDNQAWAPLDTGWVDQHFPWSRPSCSRRSSRLDMTPAQDMNTVSPETIR